MADVLDRATRQLAVQASTLDPAERTVTVCWGTGARVKRRAYDGAFIERLDMAGADLSRLNAGAAVLDAHHQYALEGKLGSIVPGTARVVNGEGLAVIRLSRTPAADRVLADLEDGVTTAFSVGYSIEQTRTDEGDEDSLPIVTATRWTPFEISVVPVPADHTAAARSAPADSTPTDQPEGASPSLLSRITTMPGIVSRLRRQPTTAPPTEPAEPALETRGAAPAPHIETRTAIPLTMRQRADLAARSLGDAGQGFAIDHAELSDADFRLAILDGMADESERQGIFAYGDPHHAAQRSTVSAMAIALAHRADPRVELTHEARTYQGATLRDLAGVCMDREGVSRGFGQNDLAMRAFVGTSDFPALFLEAGNRVALATFAELRTPLRMLAKEVMADDFRARFGIRIDRGDYSFERVDEHGEYTHAVIANSKEAIALETYGRIFKLTRRAIINDDLGVWAAAVQAQAQAAAAIEGDKLAGLIEGNPTLASDGKPVFHASHGNLAATGGALTVGNLGGARLAMRRQRGLGANRITSKPRYLLVSPEMETEAEKILASLSAATVDDQNPFPKQLDLVCAPELTNPTAWYVVGSPPDSLQRAYLASNGDQPEIITREAFETDGVSMKGRFDFGCAWMSYHGWYKNPGV